MSAPLREAAAVILLRRTEPGFEVFLLRRQRAASFMASAFVFPGGATESDEDARTAAARELFEEAGVLLAHADERIESQTLELPIQGMLRRRILDGAEPRAVLATAGLRWSTDVLVPWSHWITPSAEPRRFAARFCVCELPAGQVPSFDAVETVEQIWIRPLDALARAAELRLPPPQIRTLLDLGPAAAQGWDAVVAFCAERAAITHPILPRPCPSAGGITLLLPWDPDYAARGMGEAIEMPAGHPLASGPSRFVLEEGTWMHVHAPSSPGAG